MPAYLVYEYSNPKFALSLNRWGLRDCSLWCRWILCTLSFTDQQRMQLPPLSLCKVLQSFVRNEVSTFIKSIIPIYSVFSSKKQQLDKCLHPLFPILLESFKRLKYIGWVKWGSSNGRCSDRELPNQWAGCVLIQVFGTEFKFCQIVVAFGAEATHGLVINLSKISLAHIYSNSQSFCNQNRSPESMLLLWGLFGDYKDFACFIGP